MDTTRNDFPIIETETDYDGYFQNLVRDWCNHKIGPFKHKRIILTAGPWRSYAVAYQDKGDTLILDFYSALRAGFGTLTTDEIVAITDML